MYVHALGHSPRFADRVAKMLERVEHRPAMCQADRKAAYRLRYEAYLRENLLNQRLDAMEREKAFLFASQEGRFLWHIDEALRRLYRSPETFGKCHQCGGEIGFDRLDALPHARFCIECKQREEDGKK